MPTFFDRYLPAGPWNGLDAVGLLYLGVLLGTFVFEFAQVYLMQYTGQLAMFDLRKQLMAHLQGLDVAFFDRNPVGRLVTRVTTDVDVLNDLFASGLVTILGDVLVLGFIVAIMFKLSPRADRSDAGGDAAGDPGDRDFPAQRDPKLPAHPHGHRAKSTPICRSTSPAWWSCSFSTARPRAGEEFDGVNREHMDAYKDAILAYGWFYPVVEFLSMWRWPASSPTAASASSGRADAGRGGGVPAIRPALLPPHPGSQREIQHPARRHGLGGAHLQAAGYRADDPAAAPHPAPAPAAARIEFDGVWFAYKDEDWVLRDVSFTIEPGETMAVVGHTGAGKTTLISLLLRFYDVQKGAIRVGGIDIREFDPRELRRQFGVVLQDPYLFTGTLEDNIRLGTEGIRREDVEEAAEQVNLLEFIRSPCPMGLRMPSASAAAASPRARSS